MLSLRKDYNEKLHEMKVGQVFNSRWQPTGQQMSQFRDPQRWLESAIVTTAGGANIRDVFTKVPRL